MLTCTVGLLAGVGTWDGIRIRPPHIPRPWNPIRATRLGVPRFLGLLAEGYGAEGNCEAGLQTLTEALALVEQTGERYWGAELYRLRGNLLGLCVDSDDSAVEACYRRAMDIAGNQQAKSLELRAATSLVRLWQRQNKCAEARGLLAPIYGWCTEGWDTADLLKAKALLEALG
jgi:predicted ATPase